MWVKVYSQQCMLCVCERGREYQVLLRGVQDYEGDGGLVDGALEGTLDDGHSLTVGQLVETPGVDLQDLLTHLQTLARQSHRAVGLDEQSTQGHSSIHKHAYTTVQISQYT